MAFAFIRRKIKQFSEHICHFVQRVVSAKTKIAEATCIKGATYKYSCSCGNVSSNSADTFESGAVNSNNHTNIVNGGTADVHKKCEGCGKTISSIHSFSYSKLSSTSSNYYKYHKASCDCGYSSTTSSHTWNDTKGTSSTCNTTGCKLVCNHNLNNDDYTNTTHYCSICKRNIKHKMRHYQVSDGSWRYGCYYCKRVVSDHDIRVITSSENIDPTCTTTGRYNYYCYTCQEDLGLVTVPSLGGSHELVSITYGHFTQDASSYCYWGICNKCGVRVEVPHNYKSDKYSPRGNCTVRCTNSPQCEVKHTHDFHNWDKSPGSVCGWTYEDPYDQTSGDLPHGFTCDSEYQFVTEL